MNLMVLFMSVVGLMAQNGGVKEGPKAPGTRGITREIEFLESSLRSLVHDSLSSFSNRLATQSLGNQAPMAFLYDVHDQLRFRTDVAMAPSSAKTEIVCEDEGGDPSRVKIKGVANGEKQLYMKLLIASIRCLDGTQPSSPEKIARIILDEISNYKNGHRFDVESLY